MAYVVPLLVTWLVKGSVLLAEHTDNRTVLSLLLVRHLAGEETLESFYFIYMGN